MTDGTFATRMISTTRNIRQRCQLKYSKHGTFHWDKWIEYDCIFSSFMDPSTGVQQNRLELHSKNNIHEPNGKIIDLKQLRSLTCVHGDASKNEPKDIIILKIQGKKHRLGFDNAYEYNQCKSLLDVVYTSASDVTNKSYRGEDYPGVNMLYESATAMRYRVHFADLATQEILSLPSDRCELVFDADKLVLEQRHDKQYTFPRSTIRTIRLINEDEIELELGSRAPVHGFIRFRFESAIDARSCYLQWHEGTRTEPTMSDHFRDRVSVKHNPQQTEYPYIPPRAALQSKYDQTPPRPLPRNSSTRTPYYNTSSAVSSTTNVPQNEYSAFQTLV